MKNLSNEDPYQGLPKNDQKLCGLPHSLGAAHLGTETPRKLQPSVGVRSRSLSLSTKAQSAKCFKRRAVAVLKKAGLKYLLQLGQTNKKNTQEN